GNFSAVASRDPLQLAITASAVHKGQLRTSDVLLCDEHGLALGRRAVGLPAPLRRDPTGRKTPGTPSAETLLHVEVARRRGAGAVLHTHSVWTTVLSDLYAREGGVSIDGYEMLKGLAGVSSHE